MKLLICSLTIPFDYVAHAGGQTHNYYVKRLKQETTTDIHLVTFCDPDEKLLIDLNRYGISSSIIHTGNFGIPHRILRKGTHIASKIHPKINYFGFISLFNKCLMLIELKKLKKNGYRPDVIELNWTQIVFFYTSIKKIFPEAKYYAMEQDVTFLRYERIYITETNTKKQSNAKKQYDAIKNTELFLLKKLDKIFVFNDKDKKLLLANGITEPMIITIVPYFKKFSFPITQEKKNIILFYGAMARDENYMAAIWFIEKVFSLLRDKDYTFIILGSNPPQKLRKYENDRVIITGYQQDIQPYFEQALCLVAPLKIGAGIKIKVLEALSAGLPVLGSDVASEGINVTQGIDFFHCRVPSEYVEHINTLSTNTELRISVSISAKKLIDENYNFDKSFKQYVSIIQGL